jgi:hypothetical protein
MKALPKLKVTTELKAYYARVGLFLRKHPEIQYKKLVLGFCVDSRTIPEHLVEEWIKVTEQETS